jgi:hypothetical protein
LNREALLRNISAQIKEIFKVFTKKKKPASIADRLKFVPEKGLEPRSTASQYQRSDQRDFQKVHQKEKACQHS